MDDLFVAPDIVFTELTLFVCTYVAKLDNINVPFQTLTHKLCNHLYGNILAINSNFGHGAQIGYKQFIKSPKKTIIDPNIRVRKVQGDGTCFNSAIEPVIRLPNATTSKVYFIKCFPTTGETQIPGVINPDLSDGHQVLVTFIKYLNELQIGENNKKIVIQSEGPKMINYKFRLIRKTNRILINLRALADYLLFIEKYKITKDNPEAEDKKLDNWVIIPSQFQIKEIKYPIDDIKTSFRIKITEKRQPRVNIFQEGKINILGSDTQQSADYIYEYLTQIFKENWSKLIKVRPEKD